MAGFPSPYAQGNFAASAMGGPGGFDYPFYQDFPGYAWGGQPWPGVRPRFDYGYGFGQMPPRMPSPGIRHQLASQVPSPVQELPAVSTYATPSYTPLQPPSERHEEEAESVTGSDCSGSNLQTEEEAEETAPAFSLRDAIRRLSIVSPESVGSPDPTSKPSSAGRLLGRISIASSSSDFALKESDMVVDHMKKAMAKVRGCDDLPTAGTAPSFPAAFGCGTFLKPRKQLGLRKDRFLHDILPSARLQASGEDLLLLPEAERNKNRSLDLKDKQLADFEENTSLTLQAVSATESFLVGLISSIRDDSAESGFQLKPSGEIIKDDVVSFIEAIDDRLNAAAALISDLHTNIVLCRRDALLSKSKVVPEAGCRASLRAVPLHSSSLFGSGHVNPTIHFLAEAKRDQALAVPRTARSRSPMRKKSQGFKQGQRSSSTPAFSGRGGKSKGGGFKKPYERKQAPKAPSKQNPQ